MTFGLADRAANLERLTAETFDVLVVGGGITGVGVALDAASRGLRTALVERDDFSSGTSSKSSKLAHGGLRYLQQKEFGLVYEALYERTIMLRNAPHLVRELPFLIPILTRDGLMNAKIARALGSALWLYDLTGGIRSGKSFAGVLWAIQQANKKDAVVLIVAPVIVPAIGDRAVVRQHGRGQAGGSKKDACEDTISAERHNSPAEDQ